MGVSFVRRRLGVGVQVSIAGRGGPMVGCAILWVRVENVSSAFPSPLHLTAG